MCTQEKEKDYNIYLDRNGWQINIIITIYCTVQWQKKNDTIDQAGFFFVKKIKAQFMAWRVLPSRYVQVEQMEYWWKFYPAKKNPADGEGEEGERDRNLGNTRANRRALTRWKALRCLLFNYLVEICIQRWRRGPFIPLKAAKRFGWPDLLHCVADAHKRLLPAKLLSSSLAIR